MVHVLIAIAVINVTVPGCASVQVSACRCVYWGKNKRAALVLSGSVSLRLRKGGLWDGHRLRLMPLVLPFLPVCCPEHLHWSSASRQRLPCRRPESVALFLIIMQRANEPLQLVQGASAEPMAAGSCQPIRNKMCKLTLRRVLICSSWEMGTLSSSREHSMNNSPLHLACAQSKKLQESLVKRLWFGQRHVDAHTCPACGA